MADFPISPVVRRVVYTGSAGTGPYAFTFEILTQTDIDVYVDSTLKTLTTDYTVTINSNGTGAVNFVTAPGSTKRITIVGARDITRASDYVTGGDFTAASLNVELDQQTIFNQQNAEALGRAILAPVTDPASINMVLPVQTSRAGKILAFDSTGNPTVGEEIGNWRGNWAAGQAYTVRDLVKDASNANVYRANTAHTSSGTTPISSNADVAKWDLVVDAASAASSASAAAASASAAASSASAASTSASNASTSATNAASSASTATTQATSATNSATAAASSASSASSSASTATTQASNASTSASNASTSASAASGSASTASTQATNASNSASAASTSETNAASSASAASTSASNASTSATAASNSASTATTQATNSANSATASANSATSAAASAASAAALLDNFDDRYLGAKTSDPALDNDGNALVLGALYFNSTDGVMKVYTASGWIAASSASVATLATFEFVATAGQTVFTGNDANSNSLSYVAPALIVTLNGVRLRPGDDYTATNGTSITLISAAALNDELVVDAFGSFLVANTYTIAQTDAGFVAKTSATGAANLPVGTTAQRPASPATGQQRWNTSLGAMEFYNGTAWSTTFIQSYSIEFLVIAGGGGSGRTTGNTGSNGGAGAGGYRSSVSGESSGGGAPAETPLIVNSTTAYTVTVGAGGVGTTGSNGQGSDGGNSVLGSIISIGGGGGGVGNSGLNNGRSGGSGGGEGGGGANSGAGTTGQGFAGGTASAGGGGGGGAGQVGASSTGNNAGVGGNGVASSITGSSVTRAGGGGASTNDGTPGAAGGDGGGGAGSSSDTTQGTAGTANTGGGAGASGYSSANGVNGGSGIVIIRYAGAQRGTGGTVTSAGGYTIHTFTSSGTFTA
jgi:uncharacterized membrane protein YgcG